VNLQESLHDVAIEIAQECALAGLFETNLRFQPGKLNAGTVGHELIISSIGE